MSDSKNSPKFSGPPGGKKKVKLKTIKKRSNKPSQIKDTLSKKMFQKFNGQKKSEIISNPLDAFKSDIDALMKTHVELKKFVNEGMKKADRKKVNSLAKDLLKKEDVDFINENWELLKEDPDWKNLTKGDLTLSMLVQRTAEMIEDFNDAKDVKELEQEYPIFLKEVEEMKKLEEKNKEEVENDGDDDMNEDEVNAAAKIFNLIKPKEKDKDAMEMEDDGELTNEEMKKALDVLLDEKKNLNIYDKNNFLRELAQHKKGIDLLLNSTTETLKNDPNLINLDKKDIKRDNIIRLLKDKKYVDPIGLVEAYCEYMSTNEKQFSDGQLFTSLVIKGIIYELDKVKKAIQNVVKSLTDKIQIDDKVQSKVIKGKNNTEMKKVFTSSYIPQEEWEKLSSIQKALKNVKDFDQFPKYPIWKGYSEQDKIKFLNERLKWNIARQSFLVNLLQGKKVEENPYGFRNDVNAPVALNNNLYYTDKFSRGGFCPDFLKLINKLDQGTLKQHNVMRNVAKAAIKKLCERKLFKSFVYRKGVSITLDNETFWDKKDLDELADKGIKEDQVKRPFVYAKANVIRPPPNPPRNSTFLGKKKKAEKALLKGEDLFALGVDPKNFFH